MALVTDSLTRTASGIEFTMVYISGKGAGKLTVCVGLEMVW